VRIYNFFIWLWGLVYLFIASLFTDPNQLRANNNANGRYGRGGGGGYGNGKINGLKRGVDGPMGGGWGPRSCWTTTEN